MQRHATAHHAIVVAGHHVPVHLLVDEAEDDSLVAHQCLVVTLGIGDCLLVGAAVGEFPEYRSGFPLLILELLDGLNPVVGNTHRHAIVETYAPILHLSRQPWHATHFLSNGDGMGINVVNELVGKSEIGNSISILITIVVVVISAKRLP